MNKILLIALLCTFVTQSSFSSRPRRAQMKKATFSGILPEPYKTYLVEIELDPETDNVKTLNVFRGEKKIEIPVELIAKFKNVNLDSHIIQYEAQGDFLYIGMLCGKYHTADLISEGEEYLAAGQDRFVIVVNKEGKFVTKQGECMSHTIKFKDHPHNWHNK